MVFKRTVQQLIDITKVDYLEYLLTKDYSDYPAQLYKPETFDLNDVIEGDFLLVCIYGHDMEYSLYNFNEDELEDKINNIKAFLDSPYVDDQWIIHKDRVLCWAKENDETGDYELIDYR